MKRKKVYGISHAICIKDNDAGLIAEWKSACRIERAAPKKNQQPPTPWKSTRKQIAGIILTQSDDGFSSALLFTGTELQYRCLSN